LELHSTPTTLMQFNSEEQEVCPCVLNALDLATYCKGKPKKFYKRAQKHSNMFFIIEMSLFHCPFRGCASHKYPSTARCYPINTGQYF